MCWNATVDVRYCQRFLELSRILLYDVCRPIYEIRRRFIYLLKKAANQGYVKPLTACAVGLARPLSRRIRRKNIAGRKSAGKKCG